MPELDDISLETGGVAAPSEVFPPWRRAQLEADRLAREAPLAPSVLRSRGFLRPELAERVSDWFTGCPTAPTDAVRESYQALERETARLFEIVRRTASAFACATSTATATPIAAPPSSAPSFASTRSMTLTTIACEDPHPLLGGEEGGAVDQLRVVHDVFGHAALGVGFDLQSEFATWLQCRTLFSDAARPAAFCELVGAVTTYVMTGEKPALRADLPPAESGSAVD